MDPLTLVLLVGGVAAGVTVGALVRRRDQRPGAVEPLHRPLAEAPEPTGDSGLANVINLLNNRLSGITGMIALMSREPLSEEQRRTLDAASGEVGQAAAVVRDLARHLLDRRQLPATERTDLRTVLDDVLVRRREELAALNVELVVDTNGSHPVSGTRIMLVDAVDTLLSFAIERLREANEPRRVTWSTQAVGGSVIVTQTDNGPLIAPDDAARLLDPFVRPEEGQRRSGRLALVRRALEQLGGTVTVGPGAAGGAHITVTLWADRTQPEPDAAREMPRIPEFTGARILLVEDDPLNQEALAQFFEYEGHHVTVASNGVEALNRLARAEFDAVVVDLQMPVLGGRGLYEQCVERFPHMGSRFVFVTGDSARSTSRDFLAKSGQPTVLKPFEPAELMSAVYHATQRRTAAGWH